MTLLVLDSGGVSRLAERTRAAAAQLVAFKTEGLWPPTVPSVVIVESVTGHADRDANANRFLKTCDVDEVLDVQRARRAAWLRTAARRGSAVDAVVVATAEPGGTVLTGDVADLKALAAHAEEVYVKRA